MSDRYLSANAEQVAAKIMEGEAILINLVTGMYYSMSDSGALVWSLIEQGASAGFIAERMVDHFDVELTRAASDLAELVAVLEAEGLVRVSAVGSDDAEAPAAPAVKPAYVSPELEKFTDMAEMFALDPPLPRIAQR